MKEIKERYLEKIEHLFQGVNHYSRKTCAELKDGWHKAEVWARIYENITVGAVLMALLFVLCLISLLVGDSDYGETSKSLMAAIFSGALLVSYAAFIYFGRAAARQNRLFRTREREYYDLVVSMFSNFCKKRTHDMNTWLVVESDQMGLAGLMCRLSEISARGIYNKIRSANPETLTDNIVKEDQYILRLLISLLVLLKIKGACMSPGYFDDVMDKNVFEARFQFIRDELFTKASQSPIGLEAKTESPSDTKA